MRHLTFILMLLYCYNANAQRPFCLNPSLFEFSACNGQERVFDHKLGSAPQFNFLWNKDRLVTAKEFVDLVKDPKSWTRGKNYSKAKAELVKILEAAGFQNGFDDLNYDNVEDAAIPWGTIGNLGYWSKKYNAMSYEYVVLKPDGESKNGIRAFKITSPNRHLVFYLCTTCGNAFYPKDTCPPCPPCCLDITASVIPASKVITCAPQILTVPVVINTYRVCSNYLEQRDQEQHKQDKRRRAHSKTTSDTPRLIKRVESSIQVSSAEENSYAINATADPIQKRICADENLQLQINLMVKILGDSVKAKPKQPYVINIYDTSACCNNRWEIGLSGGVGFNTPPRFDNPAINTRSDNARFAGELYAGYNFNHWLQGGLSAQYLSLTYQDNVAYSGSIPNTYNTIYLASPAIPIQLYLKAGMGGTTGWRASLALLAGYTVVSDAHIDNSNGDKLNVDPDTEGSIAAGMRAGIDYFFSCHFGLGLSATGQYLRIKSDSKDYNLFTLPVTAGLRFRF